MNMTDIRHMYGGPGFGYPGCGIAIRDTICKMQATQDTACMEGPADIRAMAHTGATAVIQAAAMLAIREL